MGAKICIYQINLVSLQNFFALHYEHNIFHKFMRHLTIRNVGPIRDVDIELKRYNFIIGPQSSGKSTIAKILSTCEWIEKEVATTLDEHAVADGAAFVKLVEGFHRMEGYFADESEVDYQTECIHIVYKKDAFRIKLADGINYFRKKICYIPAERNMVTLPELQGFEFGGINLRSFLFDWYNARECYTEDNKTDILGLGVNYFYDGDQLRYKDRIQHTNGKTYEIALSCASSGLQSVIPLVIMLKYYTSVYFSDYGNKSSFVDDAKGRMMRQALTDNVVLKPLYGSYESKDRTALVKDVNEKIKLHEARTMKVLQEYQAKITQLSTPVKTSFIMEEPEQNLFPFTQIELLETVIRLCSSNSERKHDFTITTHSPFMLNYLNVLIMRHYKDAKGKTALNPKDLNVFSTQDGRLVNMMQKNTKTGLLSVNAEDLVEAMRSMYAEYMQLKQK